MRTTGSAIYVAVIAFALAPADRVAALECAVPAQVSACASNADCHCGINTLSNACQVGAAACVVEDGTCGPFCGSYTKIVPVCRAGQCVRVRPTSCTGDCNADGHVDVAELVTGVGIALERQPTAVCRDFDRDTSQRVEVAELVGAVRAALHGCLAEREAAVSFGGFYDAQVTLESIGPVDAIGELSEADGQTYVYLRLGPDSYIQLSGARTDADVTLDGDYVTDDIYTPVSASAHIRSVEDAEVVEGTFVPRRAFGAVPTDFVMRRSTRVTPQRFAGPYQVRFFGSPSGALGVFRATVTLEVGPHGMAMMSEATEVDNDGASLGTITSGDCDIAPEGALSCRTQYLNAATGDVEQLFLTGILSVTPEGAVSGEGEFLAGVGPPVRLHLDVFGPWDAVRLPAPTQ